MWDGLAPKPYNMDTYSIFDYDVLLGHGLNVLANIDKKALTDFVDAPIIVTDKALRDALNYQMVESYSDRTGHPVHIYHSVDKFEQVELSNKLQDRMWRVSSSLSKDSLGKLPLAIDMKVMITKNIAISFRVVNGSEGILESIKYETDDRGLRYAVCAYVQIKDSGSQAPGLDKDVVPILPQNVWFKYSSTFSATYRISQSQLPLLPAYAFIDYKIQRCSLKKVIVELAGCRTLQSVYVMLSRATSLKNLAVLHYFPANKISGTLSQELHSNLDS
jgi:hypothetical protein